MRVLWSLLLVGVSYGIGAQQFTDNNQPPLPNPDELPGHAELPDPFTFFDGRKVETPEQWYAERRPELKRLFQHYVYGYQPPRPAVESDVTATVPDVFGGKATLKQVTLSFPELPAEAPKIRLALFVPNDRNQAAPVFLTINKCGNHTVAPVEALLVPDGYVHEQCPDPIEDQRGMDTDFWEVEYLIDRGYAFATFHESDIDPDKDDFTDGIHPYFEDAVGPQETRWGTISAWAWGISRCVDYLAADPDINREQIAVTGHSRRGKTALFAAAMDERIALVVPHQSGTGGMALSRENDQERVERINRVFPHWFNDTFPKFNDREEHLPVDQHLLVALVAPRPVFDGAGLQDTWANYESALRNLRAASPVYEFLGETGIVGEGMLADDAEVTPETAGNLLQFRLDTKHTLNRDYWRAILDFADLHFG